MHISVITGLLISLIFSDLPTLSGMLGFSLPYMVIAYLVMIFLEFTYRQFKRYLTSKEIK
jgi:hypothetical protein